MDKSRPMRYPRQSTISLQLLGVPRTSITKRESGFADSPDVRQKTLVTPADCPHDKITMLSGRGTGKAPLIARILFMGLRRANSGSS
jgi:hypothetical protein